MAESAQSLGVAYVTTLPIPHLVPPGLNAREHWAAKSRRVRKEKQIVSLLIAKYEAPPLPVVVTMTRCAPRLLDDDNAVGALKNVRDAVAHWLGIDDRDPRVTWKVEQRKVSRKEQGTVIRVERRNA
ncbi:MAG TPA: hypothetical protein VGK73_34970 [Polyangiaceae bacterium]